MERGALNAIQEELREIHAMWNGRLDELIQIAATREECDDLILMMGSYLDPVIAETMPSLSVPSLSGRVFPLKRPQREAGQGFRVP